MRQILCLSADLWRTVPTRTQQLMTRMRDAQVLLFEPPGKYSRQPGRRVRPGLTVCALPPVLEAEERHHLLFRLLQCIYGLRHGSQPCLFPHRCQSC